MGVRQESGEREREINVRAESVEMKVAFSYAQRNLIKICQNKCMYTLVEPDCAVSKTV